MMVRRKIAQSPSETDAESAIAAEAGMGLLLVSALLLLPASQDFLSITCQHIGEAKG